jgi:hypothetical protein
LRMSLPLSLRVFASSRETNSDFAAAKCWAFG